MGGKLLARHPILIVGHAAEPQPVARQESPFCAQLVAWRLLREVERLAGFRSALLATHHARHYARCRQESRIAIQ